MLPVFNPLQVTTFRNQELQLKVKGNSNCQSQANLNPNHPFVSLPTEKGKNKKQSSRFEAEPKHLLSFIAKKLTTI